MQGSGHNMTDEERTAAAMRIWNKEKGLAATVLIFGWCAKVRQQAPIGYVAFFLTVPQLYFALLIYSYAIHLRKGSYRSLPRTTDSSYSQYTSLNGSARGAHFPETVLGDDDEESDGFYRMPLAAASHAVPRTPIPQTGSSIASFADFVSAPGRGRRFRSQGGAATPSGLNAVGKTNPGDKDVDYADEVLFDSDELGHSKFGTEESTSVSSRDDDVSGRRTPGEIGYSRERSGYSSAA